MTSDADPPTLRPPILRPPNLTTQCVVAALLIIHATLLVWGASRHSPTFDEVAYLPAGVSHWVFGRFDLASVSPPLVRTVAAIPVVLADPKTEWRHYDSSPSTRPAHLVGRDFTTANGGRTFWLFTIARWACIPFSLIGGYVCFAWGRALYGSASGLLACTLWCFSPNILAHGQLMTPDLGTTALGVAAAFTFWRWLVLPNWRQALIAGLVLGFAQLTKSTLVIYFLLWPLLWLGARIRHKVAWRHESLQMAVLLLLALYILNLGYGFQGTGKSLGDYEFQSRTLSGNNTGEAGNRFVTWGLGWCPVPLPENYLRGVDFQKKQLENRGNWQRSYLRGKWQDHGWWYYYLYALAIKVPLGTWALALIAAYVRSRESGGRSRGSGVRGRRVGCRESEGRRVGEMTRSSDPPTTDPPGPEGRMPPPWYESVLLVPPLIILVLVSSQTGFNHHLRYVLPIFPFVFIGISHVARVFYEKAIATRVLVSLALLWSVSSSLIVFPHSLSYFNKLVGGPEGGHAHLIDSNIDWGQDLLYLREWLREHPEAEPMSIAYFGNISPEIAGLSVTLPQGGGPSQAGETDYSVPPRREEPPCLYGPHPGWYAVSVNFLRGVTQGAQRDLRYFQEFTPVARAGYSILIYHIRPGEADRVRQERGLPTLDECGSPTSPISAESTGS